MKHCGFKYEIFEAIGKVGNFATNYQIEVKNRLVQVKNFHMNTQPAGLGMIRNSFLWRIFDDVINKLIPFEILQYLLENIVLFPRNKFEVTSETAPKILGLVLVEFQLLD